MTSKFCKLEKEKGVALVTFNRPERLNAIEIEDEQEICDIFQHLAKDSEVKAVIITGEGRAFCAGADFDSFTRRVDAMAAGDDTARPSHSTMSWFNVIVMDMSQPVIAAINGVAVGMGATMTLGCDIRIASENARIGLPFVRLGSIPELGSTLLMSRIVGLGRALELALTGRMIDAKEAKEMGLVSEIVAPENLMTRARELADAMAQGPTMGIKFIKRAFYQGLRSTDVSDQIDHELLLLERLFATEDFREAVRAFREKRQPVFKGK